MFKRITAVDKRKGVGMSCGEVAESALIDFETVIDMESGRYRPSPAEVVGYATAIGCEARDVLDLGDTSDARWAILTDAQDCVLVSDEVHLAESTRALCSAGAVFSVVVL